MRQISLLFLVMSMLTSSCNQTKQKGTSIQSDSKEASFNAKKNTILRYEVALFSLKQEDFASGLDDIAPSYKVFLGDKYKTPEAIIQLKKFVNDPQNRQTFEDCMKQYPDLNWLSQDLNKAFVIFLEEFPGAVKPQVYTYVSGFDFQYPVKYADSTMIIALDMYLGSDYKDYRTIGIPVYVSQRLTRDHILPDCIKELCYPLTEQPKSQKLLDAMIREGKILYFSDVLLPDVKEEYKMGYSPAQLEWCKKNESNLWSFLIEKELLYSSDAQAMSTFMTDGPFTSSFSQESPSRTGAWLGLQIVRRYAQKTGTPLASILKNTNSQEILEKSNYKPSRQ